MIELENRLCEPNVHKEDVAKSHLPNSCPENDSCSSNEVIPADPSISTLSGSEIDPERVKVAQQKIANNLIGVMNSGDEMIESAQVIANKILALEKDLFPKQK